MGVKGLDTCNLLLDRFATVINKAHQFDPAAKLYTGVDLGTAYVVLAVVDGDGNPVAGAMRFAQVVRDGLVVDYMGAADIVRELKAGLEKSIGRELETAAMAYPPGTGGNDVRTIRYVTEAAGFDVTAEVDEPTAANAVLKIADGAVVDIGGGTTGIAVLQGGKVVYIADEPTGGTHFSLVLAGAMRISFEEAEKMKKKAPNRSQIAHLLKPVMEKVAIIVKSHLTGYAVEAVYLAGGTSCLETIEEVVQREVGVPVFKPAHPLLVTPLGIAMHCARLVAL